VPVKTLIKSFPFFISNILTPELYDDNIKGNDKKIDCQIFAGQNADIQGISSGIKLSESFTFEAKQLLPFLSHQITNNPISLVWIR